MGIKCPACGCGQVVILDNCPCGRKNENCFEPICSLFLFMLCGFCTPQRACLNMCCQCSKCGCKFKV